MVISYCFASPDGDVPVDSKTLARPFIVEPLRNHPFMTLGDFFHSVRHFILGRAGPLLISVLSQSWGRDVTLQTLTALSFVMRNMALSIRLSSAEISIRESESKVCRERSPDTHCPGKH